MTQLILLTMQKPRGGREGGAPNILILNIHKYEQRQCDQLAGTSGTGVSFGGSPLTSLRTTGSLYVPERGQKKKKDMSLDRQGPGSQRSEVVDRPGLPPPL